MKGIILTGFGGTEKLEYREDIKEPSLKPGYVLVRVKAVALNHLDLWVRMGALSIKPELPHILGSDISGIVEKVGEGVEGIQEGEEVIIIPSLSCGRCYECQKGDDNLCKSYDIIGLRSKGGYAEFISVPARNIIKKPSNLSFEEASSYPLTFLTSWNAVVTKGGLKAGQTLFVWAGSSGIGVASIQIGKLLGATVITTAGTEEKMNKCKEIGADYVFNHYTQDVVKEVLSLFPDGVDVVVDHVGEKTFDRSVSIIRKGGVLSFLGTTTGDRGEFSLRYAFVRQISLKGVYMGRRSDLFTITELFSAGKFKPVIDRIFDLRDVRHAHKYLEESKHFGKIVLKVS